MDNVPPDFFGWLFGRRGGPPAGAPVGTTASMPSERAQSETVDTTSEREENMADRAEEANAYMKEKMLFTPRMFQIINTVAPEAGERFADFYNTIWQDGALERKIKELMFTAIGVAYRSPACLIHVVPAIEAGATDGEIFEAVSVGMIAGGFVPGGPGIPYAFQYALKVLEVAGKYRAGEPWEYVEPAEFKM